MTYKLECLNPRKIEKVETLLRNRSIDFFRYPLFEFFPFWYLQNIDVEDKENLEKIAYLRLEASPQSTHFQNHEALGDDRFFPQVLAHPFGIKIALLDAGVKAFPEARAFLKQREPSQNPAHGTFIASRIWQRDPLHLAPGAMIESFVVLEDQSADEYFLVKNIFRVIEDHPEIKIWNLSLSVSEAIRPDRVSYFAQVLDYLQQKHSIIIFKTAANDFDFKQKSSPLVAGADSQEAIIVTSINRFNQQRSLFARMGPGPYSTARPDCAYYGGDAYYEDEELVVKPIQAWASTGGYRKASGTSFANPMIAKWAAEFWALHPQMNAWDIKAHLLHSCYAEKHDYEIGYGKPLSILAYLGKQKSLQTDKQVLAKNETKRYPLKPDKKYQITYASKQKLRFGQTDYIASYLKINGQSFYEAHRSFRYQADCLEIEAQNGAIAYSLIIEEL